MTDQRGAGSGDVTPGAEDVARVEANWDDPADDAPNVAWARGSASELAPFSKPGSYLNFEAFDDPDVVRRAHGSNFERLLDVKRR